LPAILAQAGPLPAWHAEEGMAVAPGQVYVAPVDRHLLVEPGYLRVTRGPKENRFRPAIDSLFRSAAYAYGPQVVGVILSGMLDDGTAGLWAVKDRGGVAVVQDPRDAVYDSMPRNALRYVEVDHRVRLAEMAPLLVHLVGEEIAGKGGAPMPASLEIETQIAKEENALQSGVMELGPLTPFTCPECHGAMVQLQEGSILRFRCHTGHAFSAESLLSALTESIDHSLWNTVRVMEEGMLLLRHLAGHVRQQQDLALADRFERQAIEAEEWVEILRRLALAPE
jgi:two-component system chemotaxis response regulator CheB